MDFPFAFILNDDLNRRNTAQFFEGRLNPKEYVVWKRKKKKRKNSFGHKKNVNRENLALKKKKKQLKSKRNLKAQHSDACSDGNRIWGVCPLQH